MDKQNEGQFRIWGRTISQATQLAQVWLRNGLQTRMRLFANLSSFHHCLPNHESQWIQKNFANSKVSGRYSHRYRYQSCYWFPSIAASSFYFCLAFPSFSPSFLLRSISRIFMPGGTLEIIWLNTFHFVDVPLGAQTSQLSCPKGPRKSENRSLETHVLDCTFTPGEGRS